MFVGLDRNDGLPDERFCFAPGQIELLTRIPSIPLLPRGNAPPKSVEPLAAYHCYSVSPVIAHLLFKLYEAISHDGYGEYQISMQRRNNEIHLTIKGGRHYCYRIRPDELGEIKRVFKQLNMYILYKHYPFSGETR